MPKNILVIGAGIMGSSITVPAAFNGHNSIIVGTPLDKEIINSLRKDNKHPKLHLPLENAWKFQPEANGIGPGPQKTP